MEALTALTVLLLIAGGLAYTLRRLGFSTIVGYIVAGALIGPVLKLVDPHSELIVFLSEMGLILITFEIGMTIKLEFLRRMAQPFIIILIEIIIVLSLTYLLTTPIGFTAGASLVIAMMALNTSTAISFKLLEEKGGVKGEVDKLILGVASLEDVVALVSLTIFPSLALAEAFNFIEFFDLLFGIAVGSTVLIGLGLLIVSRVVGVVEASGEEALLSFLLSMALSFTWLATMFGLSPVFGSFLAGLAVSASPRMDEVRPKLKWIRELFSIIFFTSIGLTMPPVISYQVLLVGIMLTLFIVFVKFLGFSIGSWILGLPLEAAYTIGFYMTSISEFAVIIAREALKNGIISDDIYLTSIFVVALSSIVSTILVKQSKIITPKLASIIPESTRRLAEKAFGLIRQSLTAPGLENIRSAFVSLVKNLAFLLLVSVVTTVIVSASPLILPEEFIGYMATIGFIVTLSTAIAVLLNLRKVIRRLVQSMLESLKMEDQPILSRLFMTTTYTLTILVIIFIVLIEASQSVGQVMPPITEAPFTFAGFAGISPIIVAVVAVLIAYKIMTRLLEEFEEVLSEIPELG